LASARFVIAIPSDERPIGQGTRPPLRRAFPRGKAPRRQAFAEQGSSRGCVKRRTRPLQFEGAPAAAPVGCNPRAVKSKMTGEPIAAADSRDRRRAAWRWQPCASRMLWGKILRSARLGVRNFGRSFEFAQKYRKSARVRRDCFMLTSHNISHRTIDFCGAPNYVWPVMEKERLRGSRWRKGQMTESGGPLTTWRLP